MSGYYGPTTDAILQCNENEWKTVPADFNCEPGCHFLESNDVLQLANASIVEESEKFKVVLKVLT